jgi:hypothetical protein
MYVWWMVISLNCPVRASPRVLARAYNNDTNTNHIVFKVLDKTAQSVGSRGWAALSNASLVGGVADGSVALDVILFDSLSNSGRVPEGEGNRTVLGCKVAKRIAESKGVARNRAKKGPVRVYLAHSERSTDRVKQAVALDGCFPHIEKLSSSGKRVFTGRRRVLSEPPGKENRGGGLLLRGRVGTGVRT